MQVQTTEDRVEALERRTHELGRRLERVERRNGVVRPPAPRPAPAPERVAPPVPAGATAGLGRVADRPRATSLEDLVGGRVLAWAGGAAVLLGLVLLFAIAVSRGWIGEGARTLMGATGAFALGAVGVWLQEHRARTDAALAAVAASVAGLFLTVVVATQVYDLVPAFAGAVAAMLVGAAATALAVHWRAQGIAALGIVGALSAPLLAGAPSTGGTLVLLWIAAAAATGVVLWQRWPWLSAAAFLLTAGQGAAYLAEDPGAANVVAVLVAFGALNAAAALGYELRTRAAGLRPSSSLLLALNALVLAVAGWAVLPGAAATAWVGALAVVHLAAGVAALRHRRISHEIALLACTVGVVLADAALALLLDGAPLALAYAGGAVAMTGLARGLRARGLDERVLGAGLGAHVCLALVQALTGPGAPAALLDSGVAPAAGLVSVLGVAAACLTAGRLAGDDRRTWQLALDAIGLAAVAHLAALSLDGAALTAAWAAEAIALAAIARRTGDDVAGPGAAAFLGLAVGHVLVFEAPPTALVDGLADAGAAALGLGAVTAAAVVLARVRLAVPHARLVASAVAGLAPLYLASTVLISSVPHSAGQLALSALWALTGTLALVAGLREDRRPLRLGALSLLLVALAKVAIYDLSALTSVYRVGSCIVLGLLLLVAAFVWQRQRPPGAAITPRP